MAGMKTQMVMMVPQMVIMGWINFFFQGFVLSECYAILLSLSTFLSLFSRAPVYPFTHILFPALSSGVSARCFSPLTSSVHHSTLRSRISLCSSAAVADIPCDRTFSPLPPPLWPP